MNIKDFHSFDLNEDGESTDSRTDLKNKIKAFMKAQAALSAAYDQMRDLNRSITYLHDDMRRAGDHEAAAIVNKAFQGVDGNFLYSVKEALKYSVSDSAVAPLLAMGKMKAWKDAKIPATLLAADFKDSEDFNEIVKYLQAEFKSPNVDYIQQKKNYGIGKGRNPSISGWTEDSSEYNVRNAMTRMRGVVKDMDEKTLAKLNKELSKLGFSIYKVDDSEYGKYITFQKVNQ